jgi:hypothetical protein
VVVAAGWNSVLSRCSPGGKSALGRPWFRFVRGFSAKKGYMKKIVREEVEGW